MVDLTKMSRDELKAVIKAEKLGIKVHKSWSDAELVERVEEARALKTNTSEEPETPVVKMSERINPADNGNGDDGQTLDKPQKQIVPIFIGCQNPEIIRLLSVQLINDKGVQNDLNTDFDIVVMGQEVLESAVNQYFFSRLEKDNQDNYFKKRNDELLKAATLKKAIELEQFMRHYLNLKSGADFTFTPTQLKLGASAGLRKELSNKEVREVVDLLSVFDFIQPTELNAPYIKQHYKFTFSDHDMLQNTKWLVEQAKKQQEQISDQLLMLQTNMQILENNIANPPNNNAKTEDGQNNNGLVQSGVAELPDAGASEQAVEAE